jgi:hypothetical protein
MELLSLPSLITKTEPEVTTMTRQTEKVLRLLCHLPPRWCLRALDLWLRWRLPGCEAVADVVVKGGDLYRRAKWFAPGPR